MRNTNNKLNEDNTAVTGETLEDVIMRTNNKLKRRKYSVTGETWGDVNANTNNKLNEDNTVWPRNMRKR